VSEFNGDASDQELKKLGRYLLQFSDMEGIKDVREKLKKDFEFEKHLQSL
jgi:hypothetical protein